MIPLSEKKMSSAEATCRLDTEDIPVYLETELKEAFQRVKDLIGKDDDCDKGKKLEDVWVHGSDLLKIFGKELIE